MSQSSQSEQPPERPTSYPGWDGELPRHRATVIVRRDNRVLMVRDRGRPTYALPGGGIEKDELPIVAAVRELYEETSLEASAIRFLFVFEGKYNNHHLYEAEAVGDVQLRGEVDGFTWWDMQDDTPVYPHVRGIFERLSGSND